MLPHTLSRCTGITGASTPFMIRDIPLRNGSIWPVRVICPSAKMHTRSPSRMDWLAVCRDWIISRGRPSDEIGMIRSIFAHGFTYHLS